MSPDTLIERLFAASQAVRYVAVYADGQLVMRSRAAAPGASSGETDRYEELLVNPAILLLATQRGSIDCGGCEYVLIRYGNFFQWVRRISSGHISVCIAPDADPLAVTAAFEAELAGL